MEVQVSTPRVFAPPLALLPLLKHRRCLLAPPPLLGLLQELEGDLRQLRRLVRGAGTSTSTGTGTGT